MSENIYFLAPTYPETTMQSDNAVITASDSHPNFLVANIKNHAVTKTWRGRGFSSSILFSFSADPDIDTIAFANVNFTDETGSVFIYYHTSDLGSARATWEATATKVSEITAFSDNFYSEFVKVSSSNRYWRIFFEFAALDYVEVGRICMDERVTVTQNFDVSWEREHIDKSDIIETEAFNFVSNDKPEFEQITLNFTDISLINSEKIRKIWQSNKKTSPFFINIGVDGDFNDLYYVIFNNNYAWRSTNYDNHGALSLTFLEQK